MTLFYKQIYKDNKMMIILFQNILDKFNPGARQMITAGKAYLKALHGKYFAAFNLQIWAVDTVDPDRARQLLWYLYEYQYKCLYRHLLKPLTYIK